MFVDQDGQEGRHPLFKGGYLERKVGEGSQEAFVQSHEVD